MKKSLLFFFVNALLTLSCFGQQVPNGGMEIWDTTFTPEYPVNWLTNSFYASLPCWPPPNTAIKSNDFHSGNWAVKLEAQGCIDDLGLQQVYIGILACGNTTNPNLAHGIPYNQRPAQLNFYYKYNKVGTDTGFAKIVLRLLDSLGHAGTIIGDGKISIINDTNIYTPLVIPINYYLPDTPQIMQIVFATSKTLADNEYHPLNTLPGNGAYIGTTLWIDDVTVSGGTLGIHESINENLWSLYPNPSTNYSILSFENLRQEKHVLRIYELTGKLVSLVSDIKTNYFQINGCGLSKGVYFFQLLNNDGKLKAKGKLVFQ